MRIIYSSQYHHALHPERVRLFYARLTPTFDHRPRPLTSHNASGDTVFGRAEAGHTTRQLGTERFFHGTCW